MKLNVIERLTLMQILPKENSFDTLRIVGDLNTSLGLTEAEHKEFNIKQEGKNITWNDKGKEEREIEIGEKATDICVEALTKLDKEKKITVHHMSLYEKFIKNGGK